jgi:hypothetical protein
VVVEKTGSVWAHGWHLGRVLKVGSLGAGAAAAKMPPDRCWGTGKEGRENSRGVHRAGQNG